MMTLNPCIHVQNELTQACLHLRELGATVTECEWIINAAQEELAPEHDRRMSDWSMMLDGLPPLEARLEEVTLDDLYRVLIEAHWLEHEVEEIERCFKILKPWRKGPLKLGPIYLDTEWRSDWKWARVAPYVTLEGKHVLDVGGGNGYYGWRMLGAGARSVCIIDPTRQFHYQHLTIKHVLSQLCTQLKASTPVHLPLTLEAFSLSKPIFNTVFSMGVLYHRRDPLEHLQQLLAHLQSGGQCIVETLVHPHEGLLKIEGRYANMRNIWALPSVDLLCDWLTQAGFQNPICVDLNQTSFQEQRRTEWMSFYSLAEALDPHDSQRTVEGHPAPLRATILCTKP